MLTRWYDIDREMVALDEMRRRMERLFGETPAAGRGRGTTALTGSWPRANLFDAGSALTAMFQIPGLRQEDLNVEVHGDVLTVSGERKTDAPEGYRIHRSERGARKFTRSFGLPCQVDPEKTKANLTDGLLTITMAKHPQSQPKQITVSAG